MIYTTLSLLKKHNACIPRYKHLREALRGAKKYGYDTPIYFDQLIELNGLDDAIWALRATPDDQQKERDFIARIFAATCAEHVLYLYENKYPTDKRVRMCIESVCLFAYGDITSEELDAARDASWAVAWDASWDASWDAAWDASWEAAWDAAWDAARDAARAAARDAARAAAGDAAGDAARATARATAWDAAWDAEVDWQKEIFLKLTERGGMRR